MASELIIDHKKPGFPQTGKSENSTITTIEYIGLSSAIDSALPEVGDTWGDYPGRVKSVRFNPTENALYTDATVSMEATIDNETIETGTLRSISFEIRWVNVERPMFEHPQFSEGGSSALSDSDIWDIEHWRLPENKKENRVAFEYLPEGGGDFSVVTLSTNAKLFAVGINLGQETWTDKAPVATKISEYVNGPPPETDAGNKQAPVGVPNVPSGYEWRKETADSTRAGGEFRWNLTEEWLGAKKVLVDKNEIYWGAP